MDTGRMQLQIIEKLISTSPFPLKLDSVNQLGDESPAARRFGIGCLQCVNRIIYISFEPDHEKTWGAEAQSRLDQHIRMYHYTPT